MSKAIYAFSGDPITYGHIDIIKRAAKVFKHLVVAIGNNPQKRYLFNQKEREQLAKQALSNIQNVEVCSFTGMLTDFAYELDIKVIVRGLRNTDDFNFEMMFHQLNEGQKLGLDTIFIPCSPKLSHISSSAAKAVQKEMGNIEDYVPVNVKQQLEYRISDQLLIGVTGGIASGKSTFCEKLIQELPFTVTHIDLDDIAKKVLLDSSKPVHKKLRLAINTMLGIDGDIIELDKLQHRVFKDLELLAQFNKLLSTPLRVEIRKKLYGIRGLVLIESALFAEMDASKLVNNNIVLLQSNTSQQIDRMYERGYNSEKIQQRLKAQLPYEQKKKLIEKEIDRYKFGDLIEIRDLSAGARKIEKLVKNYFEFDKTVCC